MSSFDGASCLRFLDDGGGEAESEKPSNNGTPAWSSSESDIFGGDVEQKVEVGEISRLKEAQKA